MSINGLLGSEVGKGQSVYLPWDNEGPSLEAIALE